MVEEKIHCEPLTDIQVPCKGFDGFCDVLCELGVDASMAKREAAY